MARPIITLTTDFGLTDGFVGSMKGVIASIAPEVNVVDITHDVPPQDVRHGAYVLGATYRYFPEDAIHVAVIDPGVGTRRRPIAVRTGHGTFVCPDNGLLSYVIAEAGAQVDREPFIPGRVPPPAEWQAYHLTKQEYWVHPLSSTFHGRDIFSPTAAHLANGVPLHDLGVGVIDLSAFALPQPREVPGTAIGQVIHIDRFGNLITNLRRANLPAAPLCITVAGNVIEGLAQTYQDSVDILALIGSGGTLEIAFPNGNASRTLGVGLGDPVHVDSVD
jgi:S-adenosylmethionine hydrolase